MSPPSADISHRVLGSNLSSRITMAPPVSPPLPTLARCAPQSPEGDIDTVAPQERYNDLVFWAKLPGHPWWPTRVLANDEIQELRDAGSQIPEKNDNDNQVVYAYFLGSHSVGLVRKPDLWPFVEHYPTFSKNCKSKSFVLGLEEADEVVLKHENANGTDFCMVCYGRDNQASVLLCDRCNGEAHMFCLDPPLSKIPEGDWYCPDCHKNAPMSIQEYAKEAKRHAKRVAQERKVEGKKVKKDDTGGDQKKASKSTPGRPKKMATTNALTVFMTRKGDGPTAPSTTTPTKSDKKRALASAKSSTTPLGGDSKKSKTSQGKKTGKKDPASPPSVGSSNTSRVPPPVVIPTLSSSHESHKFVDPILGDDDGNSTAVFSLGNGKRYELATEKQGDPVCFMCGDGGNLIICDYQDCPRVFHQGCLGPDAFPDDESPAGAQWFCPWHCCAVCGEFEDPPSPQDGAVAAGSKKSSPSNPQRPASKSQRPALSNFDVCNLRVVNPTPTDSSMKDSGCERLVTGDPTGRSGFIRCCSCPLALCAKHQDVGFLFALPLGVAGGEDVEDGETCDVARFPVRTNVKNGYFACNLCRPVRFANEKSPSKVPGTTLARMLQVVFSRLVNGHDHLVAPFLYAGRIEDAAPFPTREPAGRQLTCLHDIREKIDTIQYRSVVAFKQDVVRVMEDFKSAVLHSRNGQVLVEAAGTIPMVLEDVLAALNLRVTRAEAAARKDDWKSFKDTTSSRAGPNTGMRKGKSDNSKSGKSTVIPGSNNKTSGSNMCQPEGSAQGDMNDDGSTTIPFRLNPWMQVVGRHNNASQTSLPPMTCGEWSSLLEAAPIAKKFSLRGGTNNPSFYMGARHEVEGVAALIAASQSDPREARIKERPVSNKDIVTHFKNRLPPSRDEVMDLLQEQSRVLRVALQNHGRLRSAVGKMYATFIEEDDIVGGKDGLFRVTAERVTMAEARMAADYAAENRRLRAELELLRHWDGRGEAGH